MVTEKVESPITRESMQLRIKESRPKVEWADIEMFESGVCTRYDKRQMDERLTAYTSLLEPLIMVLLGRLALVVVTALHLPNFV